MSNSRFFSMAMFSLVLGLAKLSHAGGQLPQIPDQLVVEECDTPSPLLLHTGCPGTPDMLMRAEDGEGPCLAAHDEDDGNRAQVGEIAQTVLTACQAANGCTTQPDEALVSVQEVAVVPARQMVAGQAPEQRREKKPFMLVRLWRGLVSKLWRKRYRSTSGYELAVRGKSPAEVEFEGVVPAEIMGFGDCPVFPHYALMGPGCSVPGTPPLLDVPSSSNP